MPSVFLSELILIITAAFIGGFLARSLKLPPVLGYIVGGIVFGIIGKNFFASYESLVALSQVGISLLLFTLGFEISLDTLKKIKKKVFIVGISNVVFTAVFLYPLLVFFGLSSNVSILFALLFSFSSTAVIVKILEEKGLLANFPGNNVFIYLLIQDLFVIPVIYLVPVLFTNQPTNFAGVDFLLSIGKPIILFILILIASRLLLPKFLNFLFKYPSHELTILATIFSAAFSIFILTAVGLPGTIAAFLAGILISDQGKNLTPLAEIRPFRDLFLVLFFVMTGMLLNFPFFLSNLPFIIGLCILVVIVKFVVTYLLLRISKHSPSSSVFISSHLSNVGEFAVVIAQIAFISKFISEREYNLALAVFILSLLFIPVWLKIFRGIFEKAARLGFLGKVLNEEGGAQITFEKFENHVVICGHGRVGRETRSMLELANIPFVIIDFDKRAINELIENNKYAIYGDPTDEDILKAAFLQNAKALVIAVPDSFSQKRIITLAVKMNPKITIFCRSHVEEDRFDLINLGVNTIVMPEREAGLRIGVEVLDEYNIKPEQISSFAARIRHEHLI